MPTKPSTIVAARELAEIHRLAQERLGLTGAILALDAWQNIDALNPAAGAVWFAKLNTIVLRLRKVSKKLAVRYYNLARAISVQSAYVDPFDESITNSITLGVLYEQMGEVLEEVLEETSIKYTPEEAEDPVKSEDSDAEEDELPSREDRWDEIGDAILEIFDDHLDDIDEDLESPIDLDDDVDWSLFDDEEEEEDAFELLEKLIEQEAIDALKRDVDKELERDEVDRDRIQDRHDAKGSIAAGIVDRSVITAGRETLRRVGQRDKRRLAWMRVTSSHPCSFCAMLAARGAVYTSERAAGGLTHEYHDNCHCIIVAVWVDDWSYTERDKYFIDNWAKVTAKFKGADKRREWRRWLTKQYRQNLVPGQSEYL